MISGFSARRAAQRRLRVKISGVNFKPNARVTFDGATATVVEVKGASIVVDTPTAPPSARQARTPTTVF